MSVVITGMDLPEKCCKCPVMHRANGICPITRRRVVDPGKKPDWCPMVGSAVADANKLKLVWANEPEILESIEKAVIA